MWFIVINLRKNVTYKTELSRSCYWAAGQGEGLENKS